MRAVRYSTMIAVIATAACQRGYQPVAPHVASQPGLSAQITRISFDRPFLAWLSVQATAPVHVRRVLLTPADAEPCHEGIREAELSLDAQAVWARPFEVLGLHELELRYDLGAAAQILAQPAALDLVLAGDAGKPDQCLRVALNGKPPEQAWNAHTPGTFAATVRILAPFYSVNGVGTGWSFDSRIGAYTGPLRLMGEVGLGSAYCGERCGGSRVGFIWLPFGASAHWFVHESKRSAVDIGLAYRLILAGVGHGQEARSTMLQAPELRLRFADTIQRGPGLPSGSRVGSGGFELFASEWFGHGPNGPERTFVLGVGVVGDSSF